MSYIAMEVELDPGRIVSREPEKLPVTGKRLLTVLEPAIQTIPEKLSPLEALEALPRHLQMPLYHAR